MLNKIALCFRDAENPTLGPIIKVLKFLCIWAAGRSKTKTLIHYILLCFVVSYLINIYVFNIFIKKFRFDYFIKFVQFTILHVAVLKIISLTKYHTNWEDIVEQVANIEKSFVGYEEAPYFSIVTKYRRFGSIIISIIVISGVVLNITYIVVFSTYHIFIRDPTKPVTGTDNIVNAWIPFDINTKKGRTIDVILQIVFTEITIIHLICWDAMVWLIMSFFITQFKSLRLRCVCLLDNDNDSECLNNIVKCHQLYLKIIK